MPQVEAEASTKPHVSLASRYTVNADSFIVHRPHASTKARVNFAAELTNLKSPGPPSNGSGRSGAASTDESRAAVREETSRRRLRWDHVINDQSAAKHVAGSDHTDSMHRMAGLRARSSHVSRQLAAAFDVQLFSATNDFYADFLGELRKGTYETLVTEGFERCRQQLPWWREYQTNDTVPTRADANT